MVLSFLEAATYLFRIVMTVQTCKTGAYGRCTSTEYLTSVLSQAFAFALWLLLFCFCLLQLLSLAKQKRWCDTWTLSIDVPCLRLREDVQHTSRILGRRKLHGRSFRFNGDKLSFVLQLRAGRWTCLSHHFL